MVPQVHEACRTLQGSGVPELQGEVMPKRSERLDYGHAFDGNPFEGMDPSDIYSELRWGDVPTDQWEIDAPEPLASLGELAMLQLAGANPSEQWGEDDGPFVAVGADTNMVYLVPRASDDGPVRKVPKFSKRTWRRVGKVRQTDYYSVKDGEPAYYYHKHERPLPDVWEHPRSGVRVLVPANHKGRRSYGVVKEGIVG